MPRKRKPSKRKVEIPVDGRVVTVTMTPPTGRRKSWYAYWKGLTTSRTTGQSEYDAALNALADILRHGGQKSVVRNVVLSDAEFEEIQRAHYGKKTDPEAKKRSQKTLEECLDAISAFREISQLSPITIATPADCERFQHEALQKPKNWRKQFPNSPERVEPLSPNTIIKWSVALQAAFERANRNAGKKCIRGVVDESKLLTDNPWRRFTWIEGREPKLRQFDHEELLLLLDFFDSKWPGISFAPAFAKVCLWSWGRREEISSLKWSMLRVVGSEYHFESKGKWGVSKWFRIPEELYDELKALSVESEFVFGCYADQLRQFHLNGGCKGAAAQIRDEFRPENLGDWFYRRVSEWSSSLPNGSAYVHVFRKTTLQYARSGEDVNRMVAKDARLSEQVMMTSYAKETDEEMRQKSNRTFRRILNSLPIEVAVRYGYRESPADRIAERLDLARAQGDWSVVATLARQLADLQAS